MKIAIITMTGDNYGSALQAYALQHAFSDLGADVRTIKLIPGSPLKSKLGQVFRVFKSNYNNKIDRIHSILKNGRKSKKIDSFYSSNLKMLEVNDTSNIDETFNPHAYVCGSDQIWNPQFFHNRLFYLDFLNRDVKKYSYAVSLAVDSITSDQRSYYEEKLRVFDRISVREETGKIILENVFANKNIRTDLDPVLLYDAEEWKKLESQKYAGGGYTLLYMLRYSEELIQKTESFANTTGSKVLYLGDYYYHSKNITFLGGDGVEDFLSAIIHADFVITNSFHATAFSVLFEKNFASMVIERTGSRVNDFLNMVQLEDRIINNSELDKILINNPEFKTAREVLIDRRNKSTSYLNDIVSLR